jgi:hypothetical protein
MFQVVDQFAGTSSLHATRAAALAAGRSLARGLAELRGLGALVEEACSCDTLICGTVLDDAGEAIDLEPLVWIDPSPGPVPLPLENSTQRVVRMANQLPLEPWVGALTTSHA